MELVGVGLSLQRRGKDRRLVSAGLHPKSISGNARCATPVERKRDVETTSSEASIPQEARDGKQGASAICTIFDEEKTRERKRERVYSRSLASLIRPSLNRAPILYRCN